MRMRRALITGITGQDGWYLAQLLRQHGIEIWGSARNGQMPAELDFVHAAPPADLMDQESLNALVSRVQPDEVYHLAAQSSVAASWDDPVGTADVTGLGTARLLESIRLHAPDARVFIAVSSEIFGEPDHSPQNEQTPIRPVSPYGAAKAYSMHVARSYRQRRGMFVACGILYNHESPRRPLSFVSRKITAGAAAIARGEQTELRLGNLDAVRDWGFAGDYVRAMYLMLQQEEPDDFVIATGEGHTVREFCELAFNAVDLDYQDHVVSDPAYWRPAEPVPLIGDASKAARSLGWSSTVDLPGLVTRLTAESHLLDGRQPVVRHAL
jgi:GDPmannose 4,6-dehydratase